MSDRKRIGIVGGGGAGLVSAWLMQDEAQVTVYERDAVLGGHAQTVDVETPVGPLAIDTGFRYFFPHTYPRLVALLRALDVPWEQHPSSMSFTRAGASDTLVTPPRSARHVLRLLSSPPDLVRALYFLWFLQAGRRVVDSGDWSASLDDYLAQVGVPRWVADSYLVPCLAACWGAPIEDMHRFPAYDVLKVMRQGKAGAVTFLDVVGGARAYMRALIAGLDRVDLRTSEPVQRVVRTATGYRVRGASGREEEHDALVLATPAWDVAPLFDGGPRPAIADVASGFRAFPTDIAIHRDPTWMPPNRADWCGINARYDGRHVWTTEWAAMDRGQEVFRTWLTPNDEAPAHTLHRVRFRHLLVDGESRRRHLELARLQGVENLYVAGMYTTDTDNHESVVSSAMTVATALTPGSARLRRLST